MGGRKRPGSVGCRPFLEQGLFATGVEDGHDLRQHARRSLGRLLSTEAVNNARDGGSAHGLRRRSDHLRGDCFSPQTPLSKMPAIAGTLSLRNFSEPASRVFVSQGDFTGRFAPSSGGVPQNMVTLHVANGGCRFVEGAIAQSAGRAWWDGLGPPKKRARIIEPQGLATIFRGGELEQRGQIKFQRPDEKHVFPDGSIHPSRQTKKGVHKQNQGDMKQTKRVPRTNKEGVCKQKGALCKTTRPYEKKGPYEKQKNGK